MYFWAHDLQCCVGSFALLLDALENIDSFALPPDVAEDVDYPEDDEEGALENIDSFAFPLDVAEDVGPEECGEAHVHNSEGGRNHSEIDSLGGKPEKAARRKCWYNLVSELLCDVLLSLHVAHGSEEAHQENRGQDTLV